MDNVTFRVISFIQVSGVSPSAGGRVLSQLSWLGLSVCSCFPLGNEGRRVRAVLEDSKLLSVGACASPGAVTAGIGSKAGAVPCAGDSGASITLCPCARGCW